MFNLFNAYRSLIIRFNMQKLYTAHRVYLRVLYESQNIVRLVPH